MYSFFNTLLITTISSLNWSPNAVMYVLSNTFLPWLNAITFSKTTSSICPYDNPS